MSKLYGLTSTLMPENIFHTCRYGVSFENCSSGHWHHCQTIALRHTQTHIHRHAPHSLSPKSRANWERKGCARSQADKTIAVLIHHQLSWNAFLVNTKHSRPNLLILRCTHFSKYVLFLQKFQNFNIETAWLKKRKKERHVL